MTQKTLFRILLLGLPIGSVALGAFSLVAHFMKRASNEHAANRNAAKEVAKADLAFYMRRLAVDIGPRHLGDEPKLRQAAAFIEGTLGPNNIGFPAVERHTYEVEGKEASNLIAENPGGSRRGEVIVVGAHYDTVAASPGANDNGSGVAAMLSLAQAFVGTKTQRTLRFAAFVNEEAYFLTEKMGSYQYAKRCKDRGDRIVAMISLETLGYYSDQPGSQHYPPPLADQFPSVGNFVAFVGPTAARDIIQQCRDHFTAGSSFPVQAADFPSLVPDALRSDHWSFLQFGIPGFMVTDTANFRYAHYHSPNDTPDKISIDHLTEVVKALASMLRRLANPEP